MSNNSDIFEKYAEIALKKGLISKGEGAKEKLEKNPRLSSQDASAIELLYGIKPDAPKGMSYEKNIAEIAHPNAVIVSPAHDKLNGLVENVNELNNILINIVNKPVNGQLMSKKYATDELVRSLVRIANDMDNKNSDELRILADKCIEQLNKKGWIPYAIGAAVAVLGGVYLQQHANMANIGLEENAKRLISELEDFKGEHLIGTDYTESFQKTIDKIIDRVNLLLKKYQEFRGAIDELQKPKDLEEMKVYMEGNKVDFPKLYQEFNDLVRKAYTLFDQIEKRFTDEAYQTEQMKNVGIAERVNRFFGRIFSGGDHSLAANDFVDVLRALAPFKASLETTLKTLKDADEFAKKEWEAMKNAPQTVPLPSNTPAAPQKSKNPLENIDLLNKALDA